MRCKSCDNIIDDHLFEEVIVGGTEEEPIYEKRLRDLCSDCMFELAEGGEEEFEMYLDKDHYQHMELEDLGMFVEEGNIEY